MIRLLNQLKRISLASVVTVLAVLFASPAIAADIHSNGTGGGKWSDASTWKGGKLPTAEDTAVIAMRDTVTFESNHAETVTCASLFLDPEAVLILKPVEDASTVLNVNGGIESYGVLKMDATRAPSATLELRFGGPDGQHEFKLRPNAALLLYGYENYDQEDGPNVRIIGYPDAAPHYHAQINAKGEAAIEVDNIYLYDVGLAFTHIDNTGSKPTERLNIKNNIFRGYGWVSLYGCDTPAIRNNDFDGLDRNNIHSGIHLISTKLADIRGNRIKGRFPRGIMIQYDTDSTAAENVIENSVDGIYWHGVNGMMRDNLIVNTQHGVRMHAGSAVLENVMVDNASQYAFHVTKFDVQLSTCRARNMPEGKPMLYLDDATATLLNCDIGYDQIKTGGKVRGDFWVESMQYLVVKVAGDLPQGAQVTVRTSEQSGGVPKGKADLNVRNAPALITYGGMTPLPQTQKSLVLRAWRLENGGNRTNAPFYDLKVLGPAGESEPKVLAEQMIEPTEAWFRPEPDAPEPTVEVNVQ